MLFRSDKVQTTIAQWFATQLSDTYKTKISVQGVNISLFKSIVLEKVMVEDQHKDTLCYIGTLSLKIDSLNLFNRRVHLGDINLEDSKIRISKTAKELNYSFLSDTTATKSDSINPWKVTFHSLNITNSQFRYKDLTAPDTLRKGMNFKDLEFNIQQFSIKNITKKDSLTEFEIAKATLSEKSGLTIQELNFNGKITSTQLEADHFSLKLNNSTIEAVNLKFRKNKLMATDSISRQQNQSLANLYEIESTFNKSTISLADLAYMVPDIWGMDEQIQFSGEAKGTLNNLRFKKINLQLGKETQLNADLELSGLPDWENTFIYFKIYNNTLNFNDLAQIQMPDNYPFQHLKIPSELQHGVNLKYHGNFTGFPSDFVAYGTIDGSLGRLTTDLSIRPKNSGAIDFQGILTTKSFNAGKLIDYDPLGEVSLQIKVNGSRSADKKYNALISGNIDSLYFNHYRVDSIYVNGKVRNRSFEGDLNVKDNNLKMTFAGKADLAGAIPEFNFTSTVEKANLAILGIDKEQKFSMLSLGLDANFSGNNLDDLNGKISLQQFKFHRADKNLNFENLTFNTTNNSKKNNITLRSDIADLTIDGKYLFGEFDLIFRDYLDYFLPSARLPFSKRNSTGKNSFKYDLKIKKAEELGRFFVPGLIIKSPLVLSGNIDSEKKIFNMNGAINEILLNDHQLKGLTINSHNTGKNWLFRIGSKEALIGGSIAVENFSINNTLSHDSLKTTLSWNNTALPTYSGKIDVLGIFAKNKAGNNTADFYLNPSKIYLADSLWVIEKSHLHMDTTSVSIDNFSIHHNQEKFRIFGKVANNSADKINVEFSKVKLSNLDLLLGEEIGIFGELNGTTSIADPYNSLFLTSKMQVSDFTYLEKNFGDIILDNSWDQEKKKLNTSLKLVKNSKAGFDLKGYYQPNGDSINYHAAFSDYPLETLLPILGSFANKVEGIGNGQVNIVGKLAEPKFNGKVAVTNTKIGIDYTKVIYSLNDTVRFSGDSILFKNVLILDPEKNKARFNGYITHNLFNQMRYNMSATTDNLLVLNTSTSDNNYFYGLGHAAGGIKITGRVASIKLDISLATKPGTLLNVPIESPESVNNYDFIRFVSSDTLMQNRKPTTIVTPDGTLEVDLDVTATPDAKVQMIFRSTVGDAISGYGSGDLNFKYDKDGNFLMYGDYKIDKGDYMFTLQNVLVRKFRINPGGVISWNGDPYGATVDLDALYTLKAPINYLLLNYNQNDNSRRIPVQCKINLSKKLLNPAVKFDINFPTADERTKNELQQFISTQDDINRQMVSLMVMGQFFTPEYLRGRQDFQSSTATVVGSTTSDILSNQLSNWLSQISNDFDIGFNYRPGDQVNANQMELALSTQILNDRVTINGNIGNNSNLQSNVTNPVVGQVEVFVKLNKSGKIQLKAYNRANDDLIYDTSLYKQGIGLSFKEEFDTLGDLFNHYRPKKNKVKIPLRIDSTYKK